MYASKILKNANVITVDKNNSIYNCIAISGKEIIFVGNFEDGQAFINENTEIIDMNGKTILPGFYDSHGHISGRSLFNLGIDIFDKFDDVKGCINILSKKAKETLPGEWVIGCGYDESLTVDNRVVTKDELDKISTTHPIAVVHISQHSAVFNTYALKLSEEIKDIESHNGELSENELINYFFKCMPQPQPKEMIETIINEDEFYISKGVTTSSEAGSAIQGFSYMPIFENLDKNNLLKSRVRMSISYVGGDIEEHVDKIKTLEEQSNQMISIGGLKLFYDGSIQPGTAYVKEPYKHTKGYGHLTISKDELMKYVMTAHKKGVQCFIHANGDKAIEDVLEAFETAQKSDGNYDLRHTIIHAQMARQEQLDKMKELNVVPSFYILHVYYWGELHKNVTLGEEKASKISPLKSALDRGIKFTTHCDTPVIPQNPLMCIHVAVNRKTKKNNILGQDEKIDVLNAIKSYTINAAYQGHEEELKGSIEVGKFADLVVLDKNIITCDIETIRDIEILETIVGGVTVYKK